MAPARESPPASTGAIATADETSPRPIPELPAPPRRKRGLSEEERALWESVAKQTKPLRKKPRVAKAEAAADAETPAAAKRRHRRSRSRRRKLRRVEAAGCRRRWRRSDAANVRSCRAGAKDIDARLDLHGMTQTRAHHALSDFLQRAHARRPDLRARHHRQGRTTGAESERGVLRRQVPLWLSLPEFRTLVVGFEEAHIGHGGEGALYVRIGARGCDKPDGRATPPRTDDDVATG